MWVEILILLQTMIHYSSWTVALNSVLILQLVVFGDKGNVIQLDVLAQPGCSHQDLDTSLQLLKMRLTCSNTWCTVKELEGRSK